MPDYILSFVRQHWKSLFVALIIIGLCLIPSSELNKIEVNITAVDVVAHFLMFAFFTAILFWEQSRLPGKNLRDAILLKQALVISFSLGIITELLQLFIKRLNRSGSWIDLLFDFAGSLTGAYIMMMLTKRKTDRPI
ncbi:MAG: VanZ family protein [Bacteroidales bacterium]|nr:VanZ family protein [Bacteroidales bacterium]